MMTQEQINSDLFDQCKKLQGQNQQLHQENARLRSERSDLYLWFEHHHVTGTFTLEEIDAMSPKQMADHAYERIADKLDAHNKALVEAREVLKKVITLAKVVDANRDSDWHDQVSNLKFYESR